MLTSGFRNFYAIQNISNKQVAFSIDFNFKEILNLFKCLNFDQFAFNCNKKTFFFIYEFKLVNYITFGFKLSCDALYLDTYHIKNKSEFDNFAIK